MQHVPLSGRASTLLAGKGIRALKPSPPRTDARGRIQGYASVFGAMDLARDVVMPGAFRDSLARRGARGVKLLWQHDPGRPIGGWTKVIEDRHGLFVEGELDLDVPKARELHDLIERGALDGLSIGYRTEIDRLDPVTGIRRLEKLDLWEVSIVTFPLLPQARILDLKGWGNGNSGAHGSVRVFHRRNAALS